MQPLRRIDRDWLLRNCATPAEELKPAEAYRLVNYLGNLAPWWLPRTVLEKARPYSITVDGLLNAELSEEIGSCWIVFERSKERVACLDAGLVLPVRWEKVERGQGHDAHLPPALRALADRVIDHLQGHAQVKQEPAWRLRRAAGMEDLDLGDDLGFAYESGWAALAAGLVLCAERLRPYRRVWASGTWDERDGLGDIDGLEAKIARAHRHGARHFFVPQWRLRQAEAVAVHEGNGLRLGALRATVGSNGRSEPLQALRDYLGCLGAAPQPPASVDDTAQLAICTSYYLRQSREMETTEDFYWKRLLPTIIEQRRRQVRQQWGEWKPSWFVTIASNNPALVPLGVEVLGARNCLVLYTPGERGIDAGIGRIERYFDRKLDHFVKQPFQLAARETLLAEFQKHVRNFLPVGIDPSDIVFDVTPGKKTMSVTLSDIAPPGSWMLYLEHTALYGQAVPGSERFDRWRAGEATRLNIR